MPPVRLQCTPLPTKWGQFCTRTSERPRFPPFAENAVFENGEQVYMADYKDDMRSNYNIVTAYHSEYSETTKGKTYPKGTWASLRAYRITRPFFRFAY
jgi:hypothetical protein